MAWRLHENILRGEIDNRMRGRVTGRVWLAGVEQTLVLDLRGDCHPDLAGCFLTFENPRPIALTTRPPAPVQRGEAGDITAARKVRVFDIPFEEAYAMLQAGGTPPEHMGNCLYLEWHSDLGGRMVIESADYRLQVSEPAWRFTAEELAERERRRAEVGDDSFAVELRAEDAEPWDEFRHEQMLRESDALTEKYGRLLEKYHEHPDSERIIAREMGWTWLEEALDAQERGDLPPESDHGDLLDDLPEEEPPDPAREGVDWVRDGEERYIHPVQKRAKDALYALTDELKARGHFPQCSDDDLGAFVGHSMTLSAKLAGALGSIARGGYEPEPGFTIALLKRTLEILHDALTAAEALAAKPALLPADSLATHRAALFATREDILALIARLRG